MYRKGRGVKQNYAAAAKWYRKAAATGYPPAQYGLGKLYRDGQGVPKDLQEARKWLQKAADSGHRSASKALRKLDQ